MNNRQNKGITLMVLAITIIIMLILAGATISIVINGGLFAQINEGARLTDIASTKEMIKTELVAKIIEKRDGTFSERDIEEILKKYTSEYVVPKIEKGVIKFADEGEVYKTNKENLFELEDMPIFGIITGGNHVVMPELEDGDIEFAYTPSDWTNGNVVVTISTIIEGYILQYSIDGVADWTDYVAEVIYETNGAIYARLADRANNVTNVATGNVTNIDKLNPNTFTPTAVNTTNSITLRGSTTDAGATSEYGSSGIDKYYFSKDNGITWEPIGGQASTSYTWNNLTQNTSHNLRVKAIDRAGNERISSTITEVTGTMPTLTEADITFTYTPSDLTTGNVIVTINTTETEYTLQYSRNTTTWENYTEGVTYTDNGPIYARLTDGTNVTNVATGNVTNIHRVHTYGNWEQFDATNHRRICTLAICPHVETQNHGYGSWSNLNSSNHRRTCSTCAYNQDQGHSYGSTYSNISSSQHRRTCTASGCGFNQDQSHTYGSATNLNSTNHRRTCSASGCGHTQDSAHTWGSATNLNTTQHQATCSATGCGATQNQNHSWGSATNLNATQHQSTCSACSATSSQNHSWGTATAATATTHTFTCTACGGASTSNCSFAGTVTAISPHNNTNHNRRCSNCTNTQLQAHSWSNNNYHGNSGLCGVHCWSCEAPDTTRTGTYTTTSVGFGCDFAMAGVETKVCSRCGRHSCTNCGRCHAVGTSGNTPCDKCK